ncbi:MAG: hypothetical protein QOH47_2135 [Sphingomonadales bacterium]|jgi:hypothetical protein|nr:hypothetical protein [Sphingomonadales bacterium]
MDPTVIGYVLVGLAGIAGAGLVSRDVGARSVTVVSADGGFTPDPEGTTPKKPKWWVGPWPWGLLMAELLWVFVDRNIETVFEPVTPILVGWTAGAAVGTLLRTFADG